MAIHSERYLRSLYSKHSHPQLLLDFLDNYEPYRTVTDSVVNSKGEVLTKERYVPNPPITIRVICKGLGVPRSTVMDWVATFPEFAEIFKQRDVYGRDIVVENATLNLYSQVFSMFLGKNDFGMKDKQEIEQTVSEDMRNVIAAYREGVGQRGLYIENKGG